jgi:hypothetical protein
MELQSVHMVILLSLYHTVQSQYAITQRLAIIDPYHNVQTNLKCCDISGAQMSRSYILI